MREEFRAHVVMRTEDLVRSGVSRSEALRQARIEFGNVERIKEDARVALGLGIFDQIQFSWLDFKLGLRMVLKQPGLSGVAVFALAIGIPVGMAPLHFSGALEAPLPVVDGERIRSIRYWNVETSRPQEVKPYDFSYWRNELSTFDALGAARGGRYNIASESGPPEPALGAEVTASTFGILRARPLIGRLFRPRDEVAGADNVVLLGHGLWQSRFGGDPGIVGATVDIGQESHVVIGIMPEGFRFPVAQRLWLPLRGERHTEPGIGRDVRVFGRIAEGKTAEEAQTEVDVVGRRLAERFPDIYHGLTAEVVPYSVAYHRLPRGGWKAKLEFHLFQFLALLLLLVACSNVAMLTLARNVGRFPEIAVRTALGAGRGRLLSQMFVETLVLSLLATGLGLLLVDWGLGLFHSAIERTDWIVPFWFDLGVSRGSVVLAFALASVSAVVAGVVPALKVTGKKVQPHLQLSPSARPGVRFGSVTHALVIADVAIAVTVLGFALGISESLSQALRAHERVGISAEEYLAAEVRPGAGGLAAGVDEFERRGGRWAVTERTLMERLRGEPGVRAVAVADALPGMNHPSRRVELQGAEGSSAGRGHFVRAARVGLGFFAAFDHRILNGRKFDAADSSQNRSTVIVNTSFVDRYLLGRNPIGRRLRFFSAEGGQAPRWYEIVGVVGHLGMDIIDPEGEPGVYLPAASGEIHSLQLGIHVDGTPEDFVPRLREILMGVDPTAVLGTPTRLDRVFQDDWYLLIAITAGLAILVVTLVALAGSALHAMMSFSVSERTREIGIRTALGAPTTRIVLAILRRSLLQIGAGVALGMPVAGWLFHFVAAGWESPWLALPAALAAGASVMATVGLLSCLIPARRVMAIQPAEALRTE